MKLYETKETVEYSFLEVTKSGGKIRRNEGNMKNFSNYNDYSTKEELHFESKAVHGALGTEPLTGAVSMPIFQAATFRHPELGQSTGFAYSRLENPTRQELERTLAILARHLAF